MKTKKLNFIFVAVSIVMICLVFWLTPELKNITRVIIDVLSAFGQVFLVMAILAMPVFVMYGVRKLVKKIYDRFGNSQNHISSWVHFFVMVAFSLTVVILWLWGIRSIEELFPPQNVIASTDLERAPLGFVAVGLIIAFMGYIVGGVRNKNDVDDDDDHC